MAYAPKVASYAFYMSCVASGALSWGEHLRMVSFRHALDTPAPTTCAVCSCRVTAAHYQDNCQFSACGKPFCTLSWQAICVALYRSGRYLFPLIGESSSGGGGLPWTYGRCYVYVSSVGGVLGYLVIVRPDVTRNRKGSDVPWGDPQTSIHCFGHFLESGRAHVADGPPATAS